MRVTLWLPLGLAIPVLCFATHSAAVGQVFNWSNVDSSNAYWTTGTNWTPLGPPSSTEEASFNANRVYQVWWDSTTGNPRVGTIDVLDGDVTFLNQDSVQHSLLVSGAGFNHISDFTISGVNTRLKNEGMHLHSLGGMRVDAGASFDVDGSTGSQVTADYGFAVGDSGAAVLNVTGGGIVSSGNGRIANLNGSSGIATIQGFGSRWISANDLHVGSGGSGSLIVELGGIVSNTTGYIGYSATSLSSTASLTGGSNWNNTGELHIGHFGNGELTIDTSTVANTNGYIGTQTSGTGIVTAGRGAQWNNSGNLIVGNTGAGTLNITTGGVVRSADSYVGSQSTSTGIVNITGLGSHIENSDDLIVGWYGNGVTTNGTLTISDRGLVSNTVGYVGANSTAVGVVTVEDAGSKWENSSFLSVGNAGRGTLNVLGGVVTNTTAYLGKEPGGDGIANISGANSRWDSSGSLYVGTQGNGTLNIDSGGGVANQSAFIGSNTGSTGTVAVMNEGSTWHSSLIEVGSSGAGALTIEDGGFVSSQYAVVGTTSSGTGVVTVSGTGQTGLPSQLNLSVLIVGGKGKGTLIVESQGLLTTTDSQIGYYAESVELQVATVTGSGSKWYTSNDLHIGGSPTVPGGSGTLNINDSGLVSVGGTTKIWAPGTVNLNGGRFEFGETSLSEFGTINAVSGSMAGNLNHSGYTDISTLTSLQSGAVDLTEVNLSNSGTLFGNGSLGNALINTGTGQVETIGGERTRFAGLGNSNAGEINNYGGVVRFDQDVTNQAGGFVSGRGVFAADGGWVNQGVMAFSGGMTDVLGDVDNQTTGQIVTSGGATTTFYDDVIHNGVLASGGEIRTAAGSNTVFFGGVSGAGDFTGAGAIFLEGDLRPGNSPGVMAFEGDLGLGSFANTFVELAGYQRGEFDRLEVAGDLFLNGGLSVELIDGFQLTFNDEFLIADVGGVLTGGFAGLDDGDLVGSFGGMDLFITYTAGNGNDVALFTAVPESSAILVCLLGAACTLCYCRNKTNRGSTANAFTI